MTLDTKIYITTPVPFMEVFEQAWSLVGGDMEKHEWEDREIDWMGSGTRVVRATVGQGLHALIWMYYRLEDDIPCWCVDEDAGDVGDDHVHNPKAPIQVSYDTTYGYQGPNGGSCSDLHAWLIARLGQWLDERGADWWWEDEFDGSFHHRFDDLDEFGDIVKGNPGERVM